MGNRLATPNVGSPKDFWKTIKSISVADIAKQANRPLSIAIVGPQERRETAIQALFLPEEEKTEDGLVKSRALPESPFIQGFDAMTKEAGFPRQPGVYDFVIDVGSGRDEAPEKTLIYSVTELGGWNETLNRILEDRPDVSLALARNFPAFRRRVAQQIVAETAAVNAQFALLTGLAEAFPIFGVIGVPVSSISDIVMLTKNQSMMTLKLAAAYGLPVDYRSRYKELAPILGNAFGWRAIARELVGVIPGVGFIARAMIAYAGTATIGKAAQLYYETGESVSKAQARKIYKEAYEASRERVRALADSIRGNKGEGGGGGDRKRVPAPASDLPEIQPPLPDREREPAEVHAAEVEPG